MLSKELDSKLNVAESKIQEEYINEEKEKHEDKAKGRTDIFQSWQSKCIRK